MAAAIRAKDNSTAAGRTWCGQQAAKKPTTAHSVPFLFWLCAALSPCCCVSAVRSSPGGSCQVDRVWRDLYCVGTVRRSTAPALAPLLRRVQWRLRTRSRRSPRSVLQQLARCSVRGRMSCGAVPAVCPLTRTTSQALAGASGQTRCCAARRRRVTRCLAGGDAPVTGSARKLALHHSRVASPLARAFSTPPAALRVRCAASAPAAPRGSHQRPARRQHRRVFFPAADAWLLLYRRPPYTIFRALARLSRT